MSPTSTKGSATRSRGCSPRPGSAARYWEHLGTLDQSTYRHAGKKKLAWYEKNGYADRLITSKDGTSGSLDEQEIERITRERILAT